MRELHPLFEESDGEALLLVESGAGDDAPRLRLPLDEDAREGLRRLLDTAGGASSPEPGGAAPTPAGTGSRPVGRPAVRPEAAGPGSPDPRLSAPLRLRPREIQERIRGGSSPAELAAEMDVPEARVEPYAHPVLQERARVADLARNAHPVREDGPARLTLQEVLATAFAARDADLAEASWDAYRDAGGNWVVVLTWRSGRGRQRAEWTLHDHLTSSATAVARTAPAADLIDPGAGRPARPAEGLHPVAAPAPAEDEDENGGEDFRPAPVLGAREDPGPTPDAGGEDELLRHPGGDGGDGGDAQPERRRRKAVTPHWEDVLMSVRTNTKRPRR